MIVRALALDPSKGKDAKHGDYSAFVQAGRDADGVLWIEADMARRHVTRIVEDGLALVNSWKPNGFAVETNQFQELLAAEFARAAGGVTLPLYAISNTINKQTRIRRLGPLLGQQRVRFRATTGTRLLVQQLREFPVSDHDDGPDAMEMAVRLIDAMLGERQNKAAGRDRPQVWRA